MGEFVQWYYLIYLLPGGIAFLLLLISTLGGGHHHPAAGAGHGHASFHGHAHGHGHTSHAHGNGAGPHTANHAAHGTHPVPNLGRQLMTFFGIGRVPLLLVWGSALLGWGLFGFWGTQFWQERLHLPALFALPALGTALAGSVLTCRVTVAAASRLLPQEASTATSRVELCGRTGTVAYPVDEAHGRVHLYDAYGTLHDAPARVAPGRAPVARGRTVLVTDYDAVRDHLIVEEVA